MAEHVPFLKTENGEPTPTEEHQNNTFEQRKPVSHRFSFISHTLVFILTSLIWGAAFIYLEHHHPLGHPFDLSPTQSIFKGKNYIECGNSLEEALERGCEYDILANHFVHRSCLDERAILEYQQEGDTWLGYTDMNWTDVIPTTKAMGESGVYWTNQRDHVVHCAMLWRKQWRALTENRRYWDAIIASEEHVMHCSEFLMEMSERHDGFDWREKPMTVEVGYSGCVDMGKLQA